MVNPRNWSIFPQHRAEITLLYCTEGFKYRAPSRLLWYSRPPVTTRHCVVTGCRREQVRHTALAQLLKVCSERSLHTGCFACHDALNVSFSSFSRRIFISRRCEMGFEGSRCCSHTQRLLPRSSGTLEAPSDPSATPCSEMQKQATMEKRKKKKAVLLSSCCRLLWIKAAVSPFHAILGSSLSPST